MNTSVRCLLLFVLALASPLVHADALSDLRTTLKGLQPDSSFAATVAVHNTSTSGEDEEQQTTHAKLKLHVSVDDDGLHIDYPAQLMMRLSAESLAHAKDGEQPTPTVSLIEQVGPVTLRNMLNAAPGLLRILEDATLTSQTGGSYADQPVQALEFDLPLNGGEEANEMIDEFKRTVKLWLGNDGVPVAASSSIDFEGSKFFISFEGSNDKTYALQRVGSRLIALERRSSDGFSGFGEVNHSKLRITLAPDPRAKPTKPTSTSAAVAAPSASRLSH